MATNTIGRAVIVIEADATKFTGDLDKKLSTEGERAGDRAGKKTGWTFMRGVAANLVSTGITKAASGLGGLFSSAFSKGMGRLVSIDDARGKLRGLGHDAETIETIMGSALASVKGTAFGLGDAATLAAAAVASGLGPGKELEDRLRLTGDAATIAGVSLNEMGSIFGKVQTGQKAYTAELNQLADRGIPIYQWLQAELGVSAEALRDMVSKGQIDSETFFRTIQKNIGGAAQEAGQTFTGSLQNVGAAIGRIGAAFLGPVFAQLPGTFAGIITWLDRIAPAATGVGEAVGRVFTGVADAARLLATGDFTGGLFGVGEDHPLVDFLFDVRENAILLGQALQDLWGFARPGVTLLAQLAVAALAGAWQLLAAAVNAVVPVIASVARFMNDNSTAIYVVAGLIATIFIPHWVALGVAALASSVKQAAAWVTTQAGAVKAAAVHSGAVLRMVGGWVMMSAAAIKSGAETVAIWAMLQADAIRSAAVQVAANARAAGSFLLQRAAMLGSLAVMGAVRAATIAWTAVQWLLNAALNANPIGLIVLAVAAFVAAIVYAWQNSETFRRVVTAAWEGIKAAAAVVVDWFSGTVAPFFVNLWSGIVAGVQSFVGAIVAGWEDLVGFFTGLWSRVVAVFTGVTDWLVGVWGAFWSGTIGRLITLPFELGYKIITAITILIGRALIGLANWAGSVFAAAWRLIETYLVQPVADAVVWLQGAWQAVVAGFVWVRDIVVAAVQWLAGKVAEAWGWLAGQIRAVVAPVIAWLASTWAWARDVVVAAVQWLVDKAVAAWVWLSSQVTAIVTSVVNWAVGTFRWWRDTLTGIADTIRDWVTARWDTLKTWVTGIVVALVTAVVTEWTTFRNNVVNLADNVRQWVVEKFDDLKAKAEDIFQKMTDAIGRIWDGLKAIAKAPVKFVIETVLNDGLIAGWNWVVDKLKLPDSLQIAKIPLPPGFIGGGVLPGPGTSAGDDMVVVNRDGRAVARVASGEPVLSRAMYAQNRAVVDQILAGRQVQGMFQGGVLPTPGPVRPHRMPYYSARYAADMGLGTGSPVFAWRDGVIAQTMQASTSYGNRIRANHGDAGQSLYAHLSRILVSVGDMVRAGQKIGEVGWSGNVRPPGPAGAHLHFEILGGNAPISAGDTGGGILGMATRWITDRLTDPVRAAIDKIPGESFMTDAAKGVANALLDKAVAKVTGLAPGDDTGAVFVPGQAGRVPGLAGVTEATYAKAANIYAAALQAGHRVSSVGGYRGDGEHVTRRAVDFMVSQKAAGDYISSYVLGNKGRFGLQHVIWWQAINSGDGRGWRAMADRGSWTQNHKDHPHVLFNASDKLMDDGGWLQHGERAVNRSGRAEPVLTGGQWDNVQGILALLQRQQDREHDSKKVEVNVTYAPTIDPHAVNPRREYEAFQHDFIADVEAVLK